MESYQELLNCGNLAIADMAMKCEAVFSKHEKAHVGISGGADSDVVLDVCERVRQVAPIEISYDWNNTGLEYRATKQHLDYLEDRYGVSIARSRPVKSIPVCAKQLGEPFLSKMVSLHIGTLQRHDFQWEDKPLAILKLEYPDIPLSSLKWWANEYQTKTGVYSSYCIGRNKWLKEFIMENPPTFRISNKCCTYAKKSPADRNARDWGCDLRVIGTRRSEGGVRSLSGKCYEQKDGGPDFYKPVFWLTDADREFYEQKFGIVHSDCYTVWGFKRTGCVGCPFNRHVFEDLDMAEPYEPNLVRAAHKVFAESYEYTQMFREFRQRKEAESKGQMALF